jgi:hypothetical protein
MSCHYENGAVLNVAEQLQSVYGAAAVRLQLSM